MDEDSAQKNAADISDQPVPNGGVGVVTETPASTTTSSRSRLKWEPITVLHEDGTVLHPFITKRENWMDTMLLRALMVEQPFDALYGKQGAAWKACAFTLSAAQDPHGNLVYGPLGVGDKAIKKRFDEYIAYAKKTQGEVPFRSGCDDEDAPNEVQTLVEDLYEIYSAKLEDSKIASTSVAAKKADDFARAEALRNASLGMLTPQDKQLIGIQRGGTSSSCSTLSSSSSNKKLKRQHQQQSELSSMIETCNERMAQRHELQESREVRKRDKQSLQERQFNFQVEQAARANELQMSQMQFQQELIKFMREQQQRPRDDPK